MPPLIAAPHALMLPSAFIAVKALALDIRET